MRLNLRPFFPVCSIAVVVLSCSTQSAGPGSTAGQGGATLPSSSSSASGGSSSNASSSLTAANGGAQGGNTAQSGGASAGGTSAMQTTSGVGGSKETGGTSSSTKGGASNTGGTSASTSGSSQGGTKATGGISGIDVATTTGGASATGGSRASGGDSAVGGVTAAGGSASGGAATGGAATGGASSCTWSGAPQSTSGELTCYWFSQGTPPNAPECPNMYKTYCGYCGTETGKRDTSSQYPCAIGQIQNTVLHAPTQHFAAFPQNSFDSGKLCGMCVEVSYMGKTITATVVDACGSCSSAGHIDLSLSAAEALGMIEWDGNPKSGVRWKAVGCPVTEDIYVMYNGTDTQQPYFQNLAYPIASAKVGDQNGTINTGFWMFNGNVGGKTVTLTDTMGHTITGTMPTSKGSLGVQFPTTCN